VIEQERLDALWDFADPQASEQRLREADTNQFALRSDRNELATQIARALGLQGRHGEALDMLERIDDDDPVVRARVLLERGRILHACGKPSQALPLFEEAARRATDLGHHYLAVDSLHMAAVADPRHAWDHTADALAVLYRTEDEKVRCRAIELYTNLGQVLLEKGDYPGAHEQFQLAEDAARAHGSEEQVHRARWAVARSLRALGRRQEALAIQRQLAEARPEDPDVLAEIRLLQEGR
jgi:tetratricopeptide (TPR) repeat protein